MLELVAPNPDMYEAFCELTDEWTDIGVTSHGMSMTVRPFATRDEFVAWVDEMLAEEQVAQPDRVTCSYFWAVEDGRIVGGASLRHELNDYLLRAGGHIGYSVRPSARRRGIATWMTRLVIAQAAERGIDRVLIVCDDDNPASARVIENCGGVLEDVRPYDPDAEVIELIRRYWVPTGM